MSWAEVSTINGDFLNAPLDIKMHLADYKMYGEDSYVYQQKELLHGLYECTYLSMNDKELSAEALDYLLKNNKNIGEALSNVYGIERKDILSTLSTMSAVAASSAAMSAVLNSSAAMSAVVNSSTAMSAVVNSSTAMSAVVNSSTAMSAVANSSTAMSAVANSSTAIEALSKSSLRVKLTYGKKVENGLMLIMSTGSQTYFAKDFNNKQCSYIKFTDGTVYPSQDGYKGSPTFGSFFKEYPKSAFFARTYYQFNDCYMDLILIRGTIVNAQ